jgi:hypothetical protein
LFVIINERDTHDDGVNVGCEKGEIEQHLFIAELRLKARMNEREREEYICQKRGEINDVTKQAGTLIIVLF